MYDFDNSEDRRRLHNSIIIATVCEIDWETYQFRVQRGEIITGWLKFPAIISNTYRYYQPIKIGTQVVMVSASGDLNGASTVGILWSDELPAPALPIEKRPQVELVQFDDGGFIKYDKNTGTLELQMVGDVALKAKNICLEAQNISMTADNIAFISGGLTHNGKNIGSTHTHTQVMKGNAKTGIPS